MKYKIICNACGYVESARDKKGAEATRNFHRRKCDIGLEFSTNVVIYKRHPNGKWIPSMNSVHKLFIEKEICDVPSGSTS